MKKKMKMNAAMIDELGLIKAQIAELEKREKELVELAKGSIKGRIEGQLYAITVYDSMVERTDWKAVANKVGYSPQLKAAYTTATKSVTLKMTALNGEGAKAA